MFYILHGGNELARTEHLTALTKKLGGESAQLDTTRLDGRQLRLSELQYACDAVSLFSNQRLVIVDGMLARFDPRQKKSGEDSGERAEEESNPNLAKELKEYLTRLPETTHLMFVETKTLAKNNPILKQAELVGEQAARVRAFAAPEEQELPQWIRERVKQKGGAIEPTAVTELAMYVGADLRLLDNEIEKLITYRGEHADIRAADVRLLVAAVRESSAFALVDAIGKRETTHALKLLHDQLAHKADPIPLLGTIAWRVRTLLQLKDLTSRGLTFDQAIAQLKMNPYAARIAWQQASNFTLPQLETMHHKLFETDIAIKTGKSDPMVALDLLVTELTCG